MTEEIDELMQSLHRLRNIMQDKMYTQNQEIQTFAERNENSTFHRIPKKVIMKIFLFLEFSENYPVIIETCRFFHMVISSRAFQVLSYQVAVKNSRRGEDPQTPLRLEEEKSQYNFDAIQTKPQALMEIKKLQAVSKFIGNKIANQDKIIEDLDIHTQF